MVQSVALLWGFDSWCTTCLECRYSMPNDICRHRSSWQWWYSASVRGLSSQTVSCIKSIFVYFVDHLRMHIKCDVHTRYLGGLCVLQSSWLSADKPEICAQEPYISAKEPNISTIRPICLCFRNLCIRKSARYVLAIHIFRSARSIHYRALYICKSVHTSEVAMFRKLHDHLHARHVLCHSTIHTVCVLCVRIVCECST